MEPACQRHALLGAVGRPDDDPLYRQPNLRILEEREEALLPFFNDGGVEAEVAWLVLPAIC
jgi:hypothetical protein